MSIAADNKAIKIPPQHYVGFQKRGENEIPLGFMTPDGTDQAATKRKATVDNWAGGGYYGRQNKAIPAQSFENKPMLGFKMGKDVKHGYGWGQGNVKWRIEDPRGFELEISSPNFAQIISLCILEQGEIQEKCVWGRLGNENILIPVNSEVYKAAEANTERLNKKASLKDLKPGYRIIQQNGDEGIYIGGFFPISGEYDKRFRIKCEDKKRHFFGDISDGKLVSISAVSSLKLSEIFEGDEITSEKGEQLINDAVRAGVSLRSPGYKTVHGVTAKRVDDSTFEYTFVPQADLAEITKLGKDSMGRPSHQVFVEYKGDWCTYAEPYHPHHTTPNIVQCHAFNHSIYDGGGSFEYIRVPDGRYGGYYGGRYDQQKVVDVDKTDSAVRWFLLEVKFKTSHDVEYSKYF